MLKKVLLVDLSGRGWGGAQEFLLSLIDGLSNLLDWQVIKLSKKDSPSHLGFDRVSYDKYSHYAFDLKKLASLGSLCSLVKDVDIIHLHREHDLWFVYLAKLINPHAKIIFSIHNALRRSSYALKLCDSIVFNSEYMQESIDIELSSQTRVIYPIIDMSFDMEPVEMSLQGAPKLLMSAALAKNPELLFPVMEKLVQQLPKARLYLVGPSQDNAANIAQKEALEAQIKSHEVLRQCVEILPSMCRAQYLSVLEQSDIFVYSFIREPFGLAVLEACLMGKQVIAYEGGGIMETLRAYNKKNTIPYGNVDEFAYAIATVYESKEYLADPNQIEMRQTFSKDKMVQEYDSLYKKVLGV